MSKSHIYKIILLSISFKLLYIAFAFFLAEVKDDFSVEKSSDDIIRLFKRNDSFWYENIHDNGYPEINTKKDLGWHKNEIFHQSSWGFMPGYPLLVKTVSTLFQCSFNSASFSISILFSTLCFLVFYWLATQWFQDTKNAFFATLLFICMPFQYYFSMMYTEAIFAFLLMGAFVCIQRKKYFVLSLFCAFMVILRANGLVMLLPLVLFLFEKEQLLVAYKLQPKIWSWSTLKKLSFLSLPLLCFGAYVLYQYVRTGYPNAYSIAQQGGWYREMMFPLAGLFRQGDFGTQFNSWYAILFMIIAGFAWKRLPLSFNLIVWFNILLPLSAGSSTAMTRYISIIFPLFFVFAFWLRNIKWKYALLPVFTGLQLYMFYFWLISDDFSQ
ncbi:Mannosyltransferase (PIG-V) [Lishizhenia tianjinensis]|uniref:Mannosyltransferase (PIG-V) n=1 Tax=Lishizhenia tianjinensis TaxID=477690 RepID=A0A1I6XAP8_9FLAO|nr:mannosyltransferase family protein [Lishizhenia tianjinensis]SFT35378.1 Mannosyltransferase (PIG-V) [Lishizhenia tianjinensis]